MAALVCRGPATPAWSQDVSARAAGAVVAAGAAPVAAQQTPPAGVLAWDVRAGSRDIDCLSQAVYYEARGESLAGQQAVAQVVLNRARHPGFPKSVCAVVFQTCQFSFVCDGAMGRPLEPMAWRRARGVAARALDGYVMAAVGRALSFHVAEETAPGAVAVLGHHAFFGAQSAARFAQPAVARVAVASVHKQLAPSATLLAAAEVTSLAPRPGPREPAVEPATDLATAEPAGQ